LRTLAGFVPRASSPRRSTAPINPGDARSGSRSAIPPASLCRGSAARIGIGEHLDRSTTFAIVSGLQHFHTLVSPATFRPFRINDRGVSFLRVRSRPWQLIRLAFCLPRAVLHGMGAARDPVPFSMPLAEAEVSVPGPLLEIPQHGTGDHLYSRWLQRGVKAVYEGPPMGSPRKSVISARNSAEHSNFLPAVRLVSVKRLCSRKALNAGCSPASSAPGLQQRSARTSRLAA